MAEIRRKAWLEAINKFLDYAEAQMPHKSTLVESETLKKQDDYLDQNWIMVKKFRRSFKKWQKERYKRKAELDLINVAPKDDDDDDDDPEKLQQGRCKRVKLCNGDDEDPGELMKKGKKKSVIKYWILFIESVVFHIIYELYYTLPADQTGDAIFQEHCNKLKDVMRMNDGKVPITVIKVIEMIENPDQELKKKTESIEAGFRNAINQLNDFMELVHKIMSRLMSVLSTSRLADDSREMSEDEYDLCGDLLADSEWDMRRLERRLNWAKYDLETKELYGFINYSSAHID